VYNNPSTTTTRAPVSSGTGRWWQGRIVAVWEVGAAVSRPCFGNKTKTNGNWPGGEEEERGTAEA